MGQEQIGFIVVGPLELKADDETRKACVEAAKEGILRVLKYVDEHAKDSEDIPAEMPAQVPKLSPLPPSGDSEGEADVSLVDEDEIDQLILLFGYTNPEEVDAVAEQIVEDLYTVWAIGARDVCMRINPLDSNQLILYAGDGTWGGAPHGFGYVTLDKANALGLLEIVGIN
jgi:hypothetical protein